MSSDVMMSSGKRKQQFEDKSDEDLNKRSKTLFNDKPSFSDVHKAYDYLRSLFPTEKFGQRIPTIVWRHQLYPLFHNKTLIDRQLNAWSESAYIRLFRLGSTIDDNEVVIILMSDFQDYVHKFVPKTIITGPVKDESVPNAGEFAKSFDFGKKFLLSIIKKCKYKEILGSELMKKRLPKDMKFSLEYHIYDLIGSQVIHTVETPNDTLLRMT
ncbi:unnamed protein product [Medioppia subpectinata]|uniref:Uncharacterized protein n=1 Tax=Medioppia subpectinata TaxID=1979941 RepID=A0A7R9PXG7_9ACAR|nr:unnamed protein product [Medioppia subpectinata]CAG2104989.1 unnamed protein product [Medioppia subpectinata]